MDSQGRLLRAGLIALLTTPLLAAAQDNGFVGTGPGAPGKARAVAAGAAVGSEIPQTRSAGTGYWTKERMRNAEPMEAIIQGEPAPQRLEAQQPAGPPVAIPGTEPTLETQEPPVLLLDPDQEEKSLFGVEKEEQRNLATLNGQERPYPFTGTQVFDSYEQYPLRTTGKLFFSQGGRDFVCSATALTSQNQRLVWTAGHCVAQGDGRTWSTNVAFVPAYRDGAAPFGMWPACGLYTTTAWFQAGDFAEDLGAIKTCDRADGARLQQVVGAIGFLANGPRNQHWNAFGYPAAAPFNGQTLHTCQAARALDDEGSPRTVGIGCNMNGGSSGGPWIVDFARQSQAGNYLNGITSYGYSDLPNVLFSPYFGDAFLNLRTLAMNRGA